MNLRRYRAVSLILFALAATVWLAATVAIRFLPVSSPVPLAQDCARGVAERLAQAGLTGWAELRPGGTLAVEVVPPRGCPDDQAAQLLWAAFDAAASMPPGCSYRQVEATVLTPAGVRLHAQAAEADLSAWAVGALDDADLAGRVLYFREPPLSLP